FFSSRRRHTRFSRDWSSDVCSSDLSATDSSPIRARPISPCIVYAVWHFPLQCRRPHMNRLLTTLILAGSASLAQADMATRAVDYHIDGEVFQGLLVYDDSVTEPRPGLLMVPNWMGVTENAAKKAWRAAGSDYVVFI